MDAGKNHALETLVMTSAEGNPLPVHTTVKGLDPRKDYRCLYNGQVRSGSTWMNAGLTLDQVPGEYESVLIEWEAVEK